MEKSLNDPRFSDIEENLKIIRERIGNAALKSGRKPEDIHLMAVTKTVEPAYINHAIECGIDLIGENRVQEFLLKEPELNLSGCSAHLIGHLQSNKVKKIAGKVDVIQSVDTVSIAREIAKQAKNAGITQKILLEINGGNEESKFGFELDEVYERACEISEIEGVKVCGLMCVAPICEKESDLLKIFENIYGKFIDIMDKKRDNISMDILSMGMSGDYETAILGGSNLVRVGSAIFGPRLYRDRH